MDYKPEVSNRFAFCAMIIVIFPLFMLFEPKYQHSIIVLIIIVIGNEYAYAFPRLAMKLYERILFKSLPERFHVTIQIVILIGISVTVVYTLKALNLLPLFLFAFVYLLWLSFLQKQSLIVGSKTIAIGQRLFSYDSISSLTINKEGLVIEVNDNSFKFYNWALGKRRDNLEVIVKEINEQLRPNE
ncbi:hypothetical protein [Desulfosporosinus meridiei]|uniref:Uncharacterized protein n=1 Tax=Desulfosporosinus meridiei (strain ATCC BAA-275 / DSM 13257 / KCTC 12902 / NCIMB 13706 / S10) TaxID=768704 RepID=J7IZX5_DESMD|nr:hypothetical protein [Desulfosporosinus meridiei]AFQ44261.1 hypothetical protein Desmer_2332 [Desulfosporosinus meridiei DSM 13257]